MAGLVEIVGWLQGLAEMGCTFVELVRNEKRPKRSVDHYRHQVGQVGVSSALAWFERGSNVGVLLRDRYWVLDADSPHQVDRIVDKLADLGIVPLMIATPRGGGHFYHRLPADFPTDNLKTYMPAGKDRRGIKIDLDFKFPGTLLVAPGSIRNGVVYLPASSWREPRIVDPGVFLPDGKFWREPPRPFLVNPRPLKDRLAAARVYLEREAPVSIYLKHGARTLAGVASHLVVYLGLDPVTAASLLVHGKNPWNSRCAYQDKKPYPWSRNELWDACNHAVGTVPAAGVKAYERDQASKAFRARLTGMVAILKPSLTRPETERVKVERVRRLLGWCGVVNWADADAKELTTNKLGRELTAQGIKRIQAGHDRLWSVPKLDYQNMLGVILDAKRTAMEQEGRLSGCPLLAGTGEGSLIKQRSVLPPSSLVVEQNVSADLAFVNRTRLSFGAV